MGCNCGGNRTRVVGRPIPRPADGAAMTAASTAQVTAKRYMTGCTDDPGPYPLLKANRIARGCGKRVRPA